MIVSISGAPSLILAGVVAGLSRSKPGRCSGFILVVTAAIMISGMLEAWLVFLKINKSFIVPGMDLVPIIFLAGAVGVGTIGSYLVVESKKAQRFEGKGFESDIL